MKTLSHTDVHRLAWRQRLGWALIIVLMLAGTITLGWRGFRRALADLEDFAVIYESARAFDTGHNPYDAGLMHAWFQETNRDQGRSIPVPGPEVFSLYPPTTYLLMSPFGLLEWNRARWTWIFLNLLSVAVLVVSLTLYGPNKLSPMKCGFAIVFILAFGPIHTAIAKGQLSVVVAAILAVALLAEARQAIVPAAILIAIAVCLKPQIAAPVMILYLVQRRWKEIAVVGGVCASLLCLAILRLSLAHVSWLMSMLQNLTLAARPGGVYDGSRANPWSFQLVNGSALFYKLTSNPIVSTFLLVVIAIFVCFFLWKRGFSYPDLVADPAAFAVACLMGLVLLAHRYYDASVLVFVFVWALSGTSTWRWNNLISICGCLVLAFPGQALLFSAALLRAPSGISQKLWDAVVVQHQSSALLIVLVTLTIALTRTADDSVGNTGKLSYG